MRTPTQQAEIARACSCTLEEAPERDLLFCSDRCGSIWLQPEEDWGPWGEDVIITWTLAGYTDEDGREHFFA